MILSLKVGYFIIENVQSLNQEISISCNLDLDDTEKEDNTEFDEKDKINQILLTSPIIKKKPTITTHSLLIDLYKIQHLEFATPPPEYFTI